MKYNYNTHPSEEEENSQYKLAQAASLRIVFFSPKVNGFIQKKNKKKIVFAKCQVIFHFEVIWSYYLSSSEILQQIFF